MGGSFLMVVAMRTYNALLRRFCSNGPQDSIQIKNTAAQWREELTKQLAVYTFTVPSSSGFRDLDRVLKEETELALDMATAKEKAIEELIEKKGVANFCQEGFKTYLCAPCDLMVTSFPGPPEQINICGAPVTQMYNFRGDVADNLWTCTTYNGLLFPALTTVPQVQMEAEIVRHVWSENLAAALSV